MSSFVDSQKINKTFKEDHGTVQKIKGNHLDDDFEEKKSHVAQQRSKKLSEYISMRRESSSHILDQIIEGCDQKGDNCHSGVDNSNISMTLTNS